MASPLRKPAGARVAPQRCPILLLLASKVYHGSLNSLLRINLLSLTRGALYCISKSHPFYSLFLSPATAGLFAMPTCHYPILFVPELLSFNTSQAAARLRVCLDRLCLAGYAQLGEGRLTLSFFRSRPSFAVLPLQPAKHVLSRSAVVRPIFFVFPLDKH